MENADYIVAMFNDLLSRFSKARKIKCPSFFRGTQEQILPIIFYYLRTAKNL